MGWMCSRIIVCALFVRDCALARRVGIEVVFVALCSILWHCARHTLWVCLHFQYFFLDVVLHLSCWLGGFLWMSFYTKFVDVASRVYWPKSMLDLCQVQTSNQPYWLGQM